MCRLQNTHNNNNNNHNKNNNNIIFNKTNESISKRNYFGTVTNENCIHFTTVSRRALGTAQPSIKWVPGALSLGANRPERETDHSPPSNAEVKNEWRHTSTPQYVFMA
jgi:hypothetical protein